MFEIRKEKTKRGLLDDGLRIVTADKHSHLFFNMLFNRDDAYVLIEQLANRAMQRLLKNAGSTNEAPGGDGSAHMSLSTTSSTATA